MTFIPEESSFRDRDGFVFYREGQVFRAVTEKYLPTWLELERSGLLSELISSKKLSAYRVADLQDSPSPAALVLSVDRIPLISYPSEWTFSQLRKAALLTLDLQLAALGKGFSLKDASAFNIQFAGKKAVFIDLLSFEKYVSDAPWVGYGQFCRHFLAPLLLHQYRIPHVQALQLPHIDGVPLDLCSAILPVRSRFSLTAATHIHAHARMTRKHGQSRALSVSLKLPKSRLLTMLRHLRGQIAEMKIKGRSTNWSAYYEECSYSQEAAMAKKHFVEKALASVKPRLCLDLGTNTGEYAKLAAAHSDLVVACDNDERVVELLQRSAPDNLLGLVVDLANPTPSFGWQSRERQSFLDRTKAADMVLALALVHHLCIGNNLPLDKLAEFFSAFTGHLVVEFVPLNDLQVKKLLVSRKNIFDDYTLDNFRNSFSTYFEMLLSETVPDSNRVLFFMRRKSV